MCIQSVCDAISILHLRARVLQIITDNNEPVWGQVLHFSVASHHDVSFWLPVVSNSIYFLETYRYSVDRSRQLLRTHVAKLCSKNLHNYSGSFAEHTSSPDHTVTDKQSRTNMRPLIRVTL